MNAFLRLILACAVALSWNHDAKAAQSPEQTGEEFLTQYLSDFTASVNGINRNLSVGRSREERTPEFSEAYLRMMKVLMEKQPVIQDLILDPYPEKKVQHQIIRELSFRITWNEIKAAENLFSFELQSGGEAHGAAWQCFKVIEHFGIPELSTSVNLTIIKTNDGWRIAAYSRRDAICFSQSQSGLARVSTLSKALRYFEADDHRLNVVELKSAKSEKGSEKWIWKDVIRDFNAQNFHDFLTLELEPYEAEPAFLADHNFPFSEFAALAGLKRGQPWHFTFLVPGPMDGMLYRIPVSLFSARSTDRKQVSFKGRVGISWAAFSGHENMQDLIHEILPALETWEPAPIREEQSPVPPQVAPQESDAQSDQETQR